MSHLRLAWIYFRISILNEVAYRANFVVQLFQSLLSLGMAIGGLAIVFSHTETLGGWHPDELLALLGVYFLVGGAIGFVIQPSMQRLMEDVRQGTLDFVLMKPAGAQLLVSVRQVQVWKLVDALLGLGVLAVALSRLGGRVGVDQALAFALALAAGVAIVYSFWLALATVTFWFVRVDNILVVFQSMYEAGRWPITIYPSWLRYALTFLVPVAFATTIPAEALSGRLTPGALLGAVSLALVMLAASRWFWRRGISHYSGASA